MSDHTFAQSLKSLKEQFRTRFQDFYSKENEIKLFENPFIIYLSEVPENMQLELADLQANNSLKYNFNSEDLVAFYVNISENLFPNLKSFAGKMLSIFASTYICEQTFSKMKHVKSKTRSRLRDENLHNLLRVSTSKISPDIDELVKQCQGQCSH